MSLSLCSIAPTRRCLKPRGKGNRRTTPNVPVRKSVLRRID
jgi:hypothetical protein